MLHSDIDAHCLVHVDRYQMIEVLDNLVNNAIKYAPIASPITIKLYRKKAISGMKVIFSVTDKGPGLKPEEKTRIFTAYARSENTPTGGEKSSGLGLSIVKEIVQWHEGKVWVENNSEEESGCTFFVELPAVEV
jgi:signal transduction histidine kinase